MKIIANDGSGYEYNLIGENETGTSFGGSIQPEIESNHKTREQAMLVLMYQAYVDAYQGSDSQVSDQIEGLFTTMIELAGKFPFPE